MLKNLNVKTKLMLLVGVAMVGMILVILFGLGASGSMKSSMDTVMIQNQQARIAETLRMLVLSMQNNENKTILSKTFSGKDKFAADFEKNRADFNTNIKLIKQNMQDSNGVHVTNCEKFINSEYEPVFQKIYNATKFGDDLNAVQMSEDETKPVVEKVNKELDIIIKNNQASLQTATDENAEQYIFGRNSIIIISFLSIVVLAVLTFIIVTLINNSLVTIQNSLDAFFKFLNRQTHKAELVDLR